MITLCIPTFNRPAFIERLLRYYAATGYQHWILIGDSSDPAQAERTRRVAAPWQDRLTVRYEACPGLSSCAVLERLSHLITTPYCGFLGDDDFLCPTTLGRCVEFLDAHPDYSAAHGCGMLFQLERPGPYGPVGTVTSYPLATLEADTGAGRLAEFFTVSLYALLNAVHRTQTWRDMFRGVSEMPGTQNRNIFKDELTPTCVSVIRGKVKALEGLYLVRQAHETYHFPHVYDWLTDPGWFPSYQVFQRRLVEELMRQDGISVEQAQAAVREGLWTYLATLVTGTVNKQRQRAARARASASRLRLAAKRVPGLRPAWRAVRAVSQRYHDGWSLPALLHLSSPYHAEFMPIYRLITDGAPTEQPLELAVAGAQGEP